MSLVQRLVVIIPACHRDAEIACKSLQWQAELGGCKEHGCMIATDMSMARENNVRLHQLASAVYLRVKTMVFAVPKNMLWPYAPNTAFQTVARTMAKQAAPWLWMEPDAIPLKAGWLQTLEDEYYRAGKPFMGPIVPVMGHMNGVGIYPPDTPTRIPMAMKATGLAWDSIMAKEMIRDCYDCGDLIQHVWGVHEGKFNPHTGRAASFKNGEHMEEILPTAVLFHRHKDGTLINELRKRRK